MQHIVERSAAIEERTRVLDQTAEQASAQLVELAKQFDAELESIRSRDDQLFGADA